MISKPLDEFDDCSRFDDRNSRRRCVVLEGNVLFIVWLRKSAIDYLKIIIIEKLTCIVQARAELEEFAFLLPSGSCPEYDRER